MMDERLPRGAGWIEVICGGMFSGKTEELIRRLRRAQIGKLRVAIFKPLVDDRYAKREIVTHDRNSLLSQPVRHPREIFDLGRGSQVVGIDEVQFFDRSIVRVCQELADCGVRVIVAGLDTDYRAKPFEPVPELMAVAEYVTKTHAVCVVCGGPACRTQRVVRGGDRILVGGDEAYEPRCRKHYEPPQTESGELFPASPPAWNEDALPSRSLPPAGTASSSAEASPGADSEQARESERDDLS